MESGSLKRRRRGAKNLLAVGLVAIAVVFLLSLADSVWAMAGHPEMLQDSEGLVVPMFLIGLLFVVVGLLAYILPTGYSKETLWAWKTGPFR